MVLHSSEALGLRSSLYYFSSSRQSYDYFCSCHYYFKSRSHHFFQTQDYHYFETENYDFFETQDNFFGSSPHDYLEAQDHLYRWIRLRRRRRRISHDFDCHQDCHEDRIGSYFFDGWFLRLRGGKLVALFIL
jgi:hypothetical protein